MLRSGAVDAGVEHESGDQSSPRGTAASSPLGTRLVFGLVLVGAATLGLVVPRGTTAAAESAAAKPVTIRVTARDFAFALSRRSVPRGATVRFAVRNAGGAPHDFVIAGRRTRVLAPGRSQTITVRFPKAGTFRFLCSVPGHARLGMQGRLGVSRPAPAPSPPEPEPPVDISDVARLTLVARAQTPVHVTTPPGQPGRLLVVEKAGTVASFVDGVRAPTPFLDLRDRVKSDSSETGLLSIAFPPDHAGSGLAYVYYSARKGNGDVRISELRLAPGGDRLDPATERILLELTAPWENHKGGLLQLDADGLLYAAIGDGDSGVLNKPGAFAQRLDSLLGKMIRIDPRGEPYRVPPDNPFVGRDDVRPEIWAVGLRNPWRFWRDAVSGETWIGDVGLGAREEIDVIPRGASGLNFGWPCVEGTLPLDASESCPGAVPPVWEGTHADGACSVIAGVTIRDARLPALAGRFLFGDHCTGRIAVLTPSTSGGTPIETDLGLRLPRVTSFGVDADGRVHLTAATGEVYRLDPVS